MTSYTTDVRGTTQIESGDNRRLGKVEFLPAPTSPAPPQQVSDVIITGRSPTETAPTEASGYSADVARWEDIEPLLSSHLERFDSLYRRLA